MHLKIKHIDRILTLFIAFSKRMNPQDFKINIEHKNTLVACELEEKSHWNNGTLKIQISGL